LITAWSRRFIARFKRIATIRKQAKRNVAGIETNSNAELENNNRELDTNDGESEKIKTLSIFQRFKLRRKAREIINQSSNSQPYSSTSQQSASQQTPDNSTTSNVLDAINKAKKSSQSRTRK
jgi:hypothetical protein